MLSQKIVEFEENNEQPCASAQCSGRIVLGILLGWMLDPKRLVAFSNSIWSTRMGMLGTPLSSVGPSLLSRVERWRPNDPLVQPGLSESSPSTSAAR